MPPGTDLLGGSSTRWQHGSAGHSNSAAAATCLSVQVIPSNKLSTLPLAKFTDRALVQVVQRVCCLANVNLVLGLGSTSTANNDAEHTVVHF